VRPIRLTRAQQQALTRQRLLAAAEEVIARQGYAGASIDLISAEAGYSKGALYSNFESKEAIFLELLRQYMARDMAELEQVSRAPGHSSDRLAAWLETKHTDSDCPLLVAELQLQARRSPEFAIQYYALQAQQTRAMAAVLERSFNAAKVPMPMDARDLASAVIAIAHGVSLQRRSAAAGAPDAGGRIIHTLLKTLIKR
jgi:AcrR family transcriptional regulator